MKLIATFLSLLLAGSSFALAQSSGSAISVIPPNTKETPATKPALTTPGANTSTTQTTGTSNPTNALDDNRVSRTTGNPGLQTGPVK
jgi:hypothetical protein